MITDYACPPQNFAAGNGEVRLSVAIGNGDFGLSRVSLDGNVVVQANSVTGLLIGNGPDLVGREIQVDTIVNDTNPVSDRTVVFYRLQCGPTINDFHHTFDVPTNGDSVVYHAPIHLS